MEREKGLRLQKKKKTEKMKDQKKKGEHPGN